jgi:putative SOS response-associated peptidase YedK
MCGRFVTAFSLEDLVTEVEEIAGMTGVDLPVDFKDLPLFENYNVAPTHALPVVTFNGESMAIDLMQWGLVPSWSKDPSVGSKMINARSETLTEKPSFRHLVRANRCLVPMNGFFEWDRSNPKAKVPYFVPRADGALMMCAGLWTHSPVLDDIKTFTLITMPSNGELSKIHHRSPVQFSHELCRLWLADNEIALSLMSSENQPNFAPYSVSTRVNSVSNNDSTLLLASAPVSHEPDTLF